MYLWRYMVGTWKEIARDVAQLQVLIVHITKKFMYTVYLKNEGFVPWYRWKVLTKVGTWNLGNQKMLAIRYCIIFAQDMLIKFWLLTGFNMFLTLHVCHSHFVLRHFGSSPGEALKMSLQLLVLFTTRQEPKRQCFLTTSRVMAYPFISWHLVPC